MNHVRAWGWVLGLVVFGAGCVGESGSASDGGPMLDGAGGGEPRFEAWASGRYQAPQDVGGWQVTLDTAALFVGEVWFASSGAPTIAATFTHDNVVDLLGPEALLGSAIGPEGHYDTIEAHIGRPIETTLWLSGRAEKDGVTKMFGASLDQGPEIVAGIPIAGEPSSNLLLEVRVDQWIAGIDFEQVPLRAYTVDLEGESPQASIALEHASESPDSFTATWRAP